ncbi:MAG TPA: glutamate--tRNA ligase [Anaerolineae bacterium]|nr:glutamate--tRNA ligase [Anaerolineae bacterium]
MADKSVRVRIAPSPTGYFHVGSARTALFNWLFARQHGGQFIVRVEDTDRTRYNPEAVPDLIASLRWLGLDWDEGPEVGGPYGPYCQSERLEIYQKYANQLVEQGHAYRCYCSPERLESLREAQREAKEDVGYDRHCRWLTGDERAAYEAQGITPVVRLKVPLEGQTSFHDVLFGTITVENSSLDDLVLLKSDGFPTYHLAVVVDDHLMEISHIMRGDEWMPSVPKHVLLYHAFGWEIPVFAHVPLILAPTGKGKLSKRHGGVEIRYFRENGYLSEAMVNYLARVGWSYDDKTEIFSRDELIEAFSLAGVNNSPARFSYERLEWMNGYYIRQLAPADLAERLVPVLGGAGYDVTAKALAPIVPLIQERLKTLCDVVEWTAFFFKEALDYDPALLVGKKMTAAESLAALRRVRELLAGLRDFRAEAMEAPMRALADELGVKPGSLFGIVRGAVTAQQVSPPLFETIEILGRERTLARIDAALQVLHDQE